MMNRNQLVILGTVAAASFAGPVRADTIRVEANGSIQAAVDAAASGDTIVIPRGTYRENVKLSGRSDLRIVARGATLHGADGADAAFLIEGCRDIRVSGLRIEAESGGGVEIRDSDDVTIARNRIAVGAGAAIEADGCARLRVARNVLATSGACAIHVEADAGTDGSGAVIVRNRVVRSGGDGIFVTGGAALVRGNRVTHCGDDGVVVAAVGATITANIVVGTGGDGILVEGTDNSVSANVVRRATATAIRIEGSSISVFANRPDAASGSDGASPPADAPVVDAQVRYDDGGMVLCPDGTVAPGSCPPKGGD